jgi:hypothetical protein
MLGSRPMGVMTVDADPIILGLTLAALVDAVDLYLHLIRRRARRRRELREDDDAMLRSLVRVFLADR